MRRRRRKMRRKRKRRMIEEDHEDECIRGAVAGEARGEAALSRGVRTAEVKRNVNGRKSGGHRWMKKRKDIDDGR